MDFPAFHSNHRKTLQICRTSAKNQFKKMKNIFEIAILFDVELL